MKERLGRVGHYTLKTLKAKPHRCPQRPRSESVAEKSAMSTGLHAGPVEHKGDGRNSSLKYGYSEKTKKFEKIFHLRFDVTEQCQILSGRFFQILYSSQNFQTLMI